MHVERVPWRGASYLRATATHRETEILRLFVRGLDTSEIAVALSISEKTVSVHISNMMRGLRNYGVRNRHGLAIFALQRPSLLTVGSADIGAHPLGCECEAIECKAMRLGFQLEKAA